MNVSAAIHHRPKQMEMHCATAPVSIEILGGAAAPTRRGALWRPQRTPARHPVRGEPVPKLESFELRFALMANGKPSRAIGPQLRSLDQKSGPASLMKRGHVSPAGGPNQL